MTGLMRVGQLFFHNCRPGFWSIFQAGQVEVPQGLKSKFRTILSPRWGSLPFHFYPRLTPWAAFFRRFAAGVMAAQGIGEAQTGIELSCFDQESGAIRLPFFHFHSARPSNDVGWLNLMADHRW